MAGRHMPRCLNASGSLTAYDQVTIKKLDATAALETTLVAKKGSCKIHLRLVVQAFQLHKWVLKVGAALMTHSFQDAFYKEYQDDILQI
jgi:hypothetical protein